MSCAGEEIENVLNFINEKARLYYHCEDNEFETKTSFYKHRNGIIEVSETKTKILIIFKNKHGLLHRNDGPAFIHYNKRLNTGESIYYIEGVQQNELRFLVSLYSEKGDLCGI